MTGEPRPAPLEGTPAAAEATRRATAGWSVVPLHTVHDGRCTCGRRDCPSPGKHPHLRWTDAMARPASPEQVGAWWRRWPHANVGVATGRVSGVVVVDVDPRTGGDASLDALQARYGHLPATVECHTGGGGRHLYFAAPPDPLPSAVLAPGVEVKGEGGLVVVPPSRHASGRAYEWAPGRSPEALSPAPLPAWAGALAHGLSPGAPHPLAGDPPARTDSERAEFAEAWRQAGIELHPGDRYYLCPFHPDHRPSLHVDADGCRWHCFGCQEGGGIGRLLQLVGAPRAPRPRERLRGRVGTRRRVTLHGDRRVEVVGESLHQDELLSLAGGNRRYGGVELEAVAGLVPDTADRSDLAVEIDGRVVGRLRREDAEAVRQAVDDARDRYGDATCAALIRGGWDRGRDDVGLFGVVLFLPPETGS
jgi:hypothetical protein